MSGDSNFLVRNTMEILVWQMVDDVMRKFPEVCGCEGCRSDIVALALNQLPPKYVATEIGEVYSKSNILESQYRADIIGAITKAIVKVTESPRCKRA
ncbi:late competence development ComFB family protein [Desulfitibacter alkalitolerans]|uniref:late competence development ComFB family protein n=1 Tax=Desulfitibacter alkalitolerans TaxID=264641 RepID=UPI0005591618|nr:late competence development ComFB family protein [Desulfitibacter alkalitolerans]